MKFLRISVRLYILIVAPARERGLKFNKGGEENEIIYVAPARERGLKYYLDKLEMEVTKSLPRGSVD